MNMLPKEDNESPVTLHSKTISHKTVCAFFKSEGIPAYVYPKESSKTTNNTYIPYIFTKA